MMKSIPDDKLFSQYYSFEFVGLDQTLFAHL